MQKPIYVLFAPGNLKVNSYCELIQVKTSTPIIKNKQQSQATSKSDTSCQITVMLIEDT